jgi:hypothetical protein
MGMGNNPISSTDPDGGFDWFLNNTTGEVKQYAGETTKEGWTSIAGDNATNQDIRDGLKNLVGFYNTTFDQGREFLDFKLAADYQNWKLWSANIALSTAYYGAMEPNASRQGINPFAGQGENAIRLVESVGTAMGKTYKTVGEVTVAVKATDLLSKLNRASKGEWVKVYEAGILNGAKIETHYFRNNSTRQVFDVKVKYNSWHQSAFKKLGQ